MFQSQEFDLMLSRKKMVECALGKPNRRKQDSLFRARNDTYNNLKKLREERNLSDISFLDSVVHIYKIIVHKTHHEIDLETEPVCSQINFNPNLLISEESELPDLS